MPKNRRPAMPWDAVQAGRCMASKENPVGVVALRLPVTPVATRVNRTLSAPGGCCRPRSRWKGVRGKDLAVWCLLVGQYRSHAAPTRRQGN